jgi:hypothetical protein
MENKTVKNQIYIEEFLDKNINRKIYSARPAGA